METYLREAKSRGLKLAVASSSPLFLAALSALQLQARQALVFEDSRNGVLAAQAAGIPVVAVPNPVTIHLDIRGESLRLGSLAEMPLNALLAHFSGNGAAS